MLTQISDILFPNKCEIIEISNRYVYPIYKNGSSSLYAQAKEDSCKRLINEQIKKIETIDVILRDPIGRFISGFNTYVYNTKRDNPHLDVATIIYFAENYLFLNRHYAPQIFWLVNLSKYTHGKTKLRLRPMSDLENFTRYSINPKTEEDFLLADTDITRLKNNVHNKLYLALDNLLLELLGRELTFEEILDHIRLTDPIAFKRISCTAPD